MVKSEWMHGGCTMFWIIAVLYCRYLVMGTLWQWRVRSERMYHDQTLILLIITLTSGGGINHLILIVTVIQPVPGIQLERRTLHPNSPKRLEFRKCVDYGQLQVVANKDIPGLGQFQTLSTFVESYVSQPLLIVGSYPADSRAPRVAASGSRAKKESKKKNIYDTV